MASDVDQVVARGAEIDLHLNVTKCELIHQSQYSPQTSLLRTFIPVGIDEVSLLGAPLVEGSLSWIERLPSVVQGYPTQLINWKH